LTINPVASTVLIIFFLVLSVLLVALLAVLVSVLLRLNARVEEMTTRVDPLLTRAESLLTETNQRLSTIGEKAETILTQGEAVAHTVHDKVDRTTTAVTRAINAPLISVNSVAAGLSAGWSAFSALQTRRRHSRQAETVRREPAIATETLRETKVLPTVAPESEGVREEAGARNHTRSYTDTSRGRQSGRTEEPLVEARITAGSRS